MPIPELLKSIPTWIAYGPDPDSGRPKCPLMVRERNRRASTRKKETWTDYSTAAKFLKKYGGVPGWGIGFVFTREAGLVYVDLDDALNEAGELRSWCREFVEPLAGLSYMEKSPSGRGLHIITRGELPGGVAGGKRNFPNEASGLAGHGGKKRVPEVALFCEGKFTTVTGEVWAGQQEITKDAKAGTEAVGKVWAAAGIDASRYEATAGPAPKEHELPVVKAARVPPCVRKELAGAEMALKAEDRSTARFRLFCDLFRAGLDAEEVFAVVTAGEAGAWWTASGAEEKGRHQVWADVLRAGAKAETAKREFEAEQTAKAEEQAGKAAVWGELGVPTRVRRTKDGPVVEVVWGTRAMVETLHKHPHWKGRLRWNLLKDRPELDGRALEERTSAVAEWLRGYLGWEVEPPQSLVWAALCEAAHEEEFHPVRRWLEGLKWDGVSRMGTWLAQAGCDDGMVARLVGRKWLISLVARALEPGCQVDTVLVLDGEQGLFKSSLFKVLAGEKEWFTDATMSLDKDGLMLMSGHWIVELAELASVKKAEVESVRSFVTRQVDSFRPPYGRSTVSKARGFVVVGTTNADAEGYLPDTAGNRRYWPVHVSQPLDLDWVAGAREQLLAEAVAAYRAGEKWHFEQQPEALVQAQAERQVIDPLEERLAEVLEAAEGPVKVLSLLEVLGLPIDSKGHAMRMAVLLKKLGWARRVVWAEGRTAKVWVKVESKGTQPFPN